MKCTGNIIRLTLFGAAIVGAGVANASKLNSFTFYVDGNAELHYQAQVYAWTGSLLGGGGGGATGTVLYSSPTNVYTDTDGPGVFTAITTTIPGGLDLAPGNYVALLTISNATNYANSSGTTVWGVNLFSHVPNSGGGGFVFYNNGNNESLLNTTAWDNFFDFGDLAWTAVFDDSSFNTVPSWNGSSAISPWGSPNTATYGQTFVVREAVPEPSSFALLGVGLLGLAALRRRRNS